MEAPLITIFVRHYHGCKYAGDEFNKRCDCKKHLRWTMHGKQYRRKTGARSWAGAEEVKRAVEGQLTGRDPVVSAPEGGRLLSEAVRLFNENKKAQGLNPHVLWMHKREHQRLVDFSESRSIFNVKQALTLENLIAYRATWPPLYPSSWTRAVVQAHLNTFLRFCFNAGWIERVPKLDKIKIESPDTEPLTDDEYNLLLEHSKGSTRTLIKLMRWSGLAVRDASTLKREDLSFNRQKGIYRIIRERTKTGTDLYIPIPRDVAEELIAALNGNPVYVFWDRQTATSSEVHHSNKMGLWVSNAFDRAGIERKCQMVSHRLRATFAVDLLTKGVPLEHVSKLLGHKSVKTTEKHYAKWVKGRQDRLDALVSATWTK
jgi:integrase